jgi:hypothetical protein
VLANLALQLILHPRLHNPALRKKILCTITVVDCREGMSWHGRCMRSSATHLDRRRTLRPHDYVRKAAFGEPAAITHLPTGGDEISQRIAWVQHMLALAFRQSKRRMDDVCLQFGFSRHVLGRTLSGERWAGETVLVALLSLSGATKLGEHSVPNRR